MELRSGLTGFLLSMIQLERFSLDLPGFLSSLDRVLIKFDCARPDGLGVYRVFTESTGLGLG